MKPHERTMKNGRDARRHYNDMRGYQSEGDYIYAGNKVRAAQRKNYLRWRLSIGRRLCLTCSRAGGRWDDVFHDADNWPEGCEGWEDQ